MTTDPSIVDDPAALMDVPGPVATGPQDPPAVPAARDAEPAGAPARWTTRRRLAVAVVVLVLLAAAGGLAWRAQAAVEQERAGDRALAAAEQALPDILSYDHADLDDDIAQARSRMTDAFAVDYDELASKTIRPTAEQYQAVVSAEVLAASLESAVDDRASVLLFVNQTTVTTELPAPRVDQSRVRMRMELTSSGWKVAAIEPL